jgi:hypothetical protein
VLLPLLALAGCSADKPEAGAPPEKKAAEEKIDLKAITIKNYASFEAKLKKVIKPGVTQKQVLAALGSPVMETLDMSGQSICRWEIGEPGAMLWVIFNHKREVTGSPFLS